MAKRNGEMTKDCPNCNGTGVVPGPGRLARLVDGRKGAGLTIIAVAGLVGVSDAYLGDVEKGNRNLSEDLAQRYERALEELVQNA